MCGIAGVIDLAGQRPVPEGSIERMARALLHRGPDEEGFLEFARSLRSPDLYQAIRDAEPLSSIRGYRGTENRQQHLEKMRKWPERLLVMGDAAVRIFHFNIRATPVSGGSPSSFTGRSMVVYPRSKESPTGWVTIRELVQPGN